MEKESYLRFKDGVKLHKTDNMYTLINHQNDATVVKEKDVWLVRQLLKQNATLDEALDLLSKHSKQEYPIVNFTLAQFIVDYGNYIINDE